jgi:hypothetical protein
MLDELTKLDAVERVGESHVRAKSRTPVSVGLSPEAIWVLGQRCSDLIQTLMKNVRRNDHPLFEATSFVQDAELDLMPVIRREISKQGASFISDADYFLKRIRKNPNVARSIPTPTCRVGVTIYYFEDTNDSNAGTGQSQKRPRRTNLRRIRTETVKRKIHARPKNR